MIRLLAFVNLLLGALILLAKLVPAFMNQIPSDRSDTLNDIVGVIGGSEGPTAVWLSSGYEHSWAVLVFLGILLVLNAVALFRANRS